MKTVEETLLTEEGWRKLHEELRLLRQHRCSSSEEFASVIRADHPGEWVSLYLQSSVAALDRRIAQIEEVLSQAVPVGHAGLDPSRVGVGSRVMVRWGDGSEESFTIVGPLETDTGAGRISYRSPVGHALMGRGEGESVEVPAPNGVSSLEILAVG